MTAVRRRGSVNIYDYPEHLNPFREEREVTTRNKHRTFGLRGERTGSFRNYWNLLTTSKSRIGRSQSLSRESSPVYSVPERWTLESPRVRAARTLSHHEPPPRPPPPHKTPPVTPRHEHEASAGTPSPDSSEKKYGSLRPKKRPAPPPPSLSSRQASRTSLSSVDTSNTNESSEHSTSQNSDLSEMLTLAELAHKIQNEFHVDSSEEKSSDEDGNKPNQPLEKVSSYEENISDLHRKPEDAENYTQDLKRRESIENENKTKDTNNINYEKTQKEIIESEEREKLKSEKECSYSSSQESERELDYTPVRIAIRSNSKKEVEIEVDENRSLETCNNHEVEEKIKREDIILSKLHYNDNENFEVSKEILALDSKHNVDKKVTPEENTSEEILNTKQNNKEPSFAEKSSKNSNIDSECNDKNLQNSSHSTVNGVYKTSVAINICTNNSTNIEKDVHGENTCNNTKIISKEMPIIKETMKTKEFNIPEKATTTEIISQDEKVLDKEVVKTPANGTIPKDNETKLVPVPAARSTPKPSPRRKKLNISKLFSK